MVWILHHSSCITAGNVCLWTNLRWPLLAVCLVLLNLATFNLEIFRIYGKSIIGHQTKASHLFVSLLAKLLSLSPFLQ